MAKNIKGDEEGSEAAPSVAINKNMAHSAVLVLHQRSSEELCTVLGKEKVQEKLG